MLAVVKVFQKCKKIKNVGTFFDVKFLLTSSVFFKTSPIVLYNTSELFFFKKMHYCLHRIIYVSLVLHELTGGIFYFA